MELGELKYNIENNLLDSDCLVLKLESDNSMIIAEQYIKQIAENRKLEIKYVDSPDEAQESLFFNNDTLFVYITDEINKLEPKDNLIVVCKKTKLPEAIVIPKLVDRYVKGYLQAITPGLTTDDINWIISIYNGNYRRMINDMMKVSIFPPSVQSSILNQLIKDGNFDEMTTNTIWDISNAVLKRNTNELNKLLKVIQYIDVSPLGLLKVLYTNFKLVLNIQTNKNSKPADLGISDKQYFAIKKNSCGYYSTTELINIIECLTNLEYKFKMESLSTEQIIEYMICKIIGG